MSRVMVAVMVTLAWAGAAALAWAGERAGGPDQRVIRADATWVFHIDLEAARGSRLGALVGSAMLEEELPPEDLEQWRRMRPVLEKLSAVTVYGRNDPDRAVVLLRTTATPEEFFEVMPCGELRERMVEGEAEAKGYALRTWTVEGETVYGYALEGEGEGAAGLILLSSDTENLVSAIETAKGEGRSLAAAGEDGGAGLAEMAKGRPGSILLVAASDLEMLPREARASFLLENARAMRVEMGEHDGRVYGTVRLTAESAERARQVADLGRGVVAMGQMMAGQEARLAGLRAALGAMSIETEGESATLSFTYDAATVLEAMLEARRTGREIREKREPGGRSPVGGETGKEPAGR